MVHTFMEIFLFYCSLTFCSLIQNRITVKGVHEFARALQVNQSLQRLKSVQSFMSYVLRLWDM